jgi:hypothetical protein
MAPKKKDAPRREPTDDDLRRMGMSEEQIADIKRQRGLSTEEKKRESQDEEAKRRETDKLQKIRQKEAEEVARHEEETQRAAAQARFEALERELAEKERLREEAVLQAAREAKEKRMREREEAARVQAEKRRQQELEMASWTAEQREAHLRAFDERESQLVRQREEELERKAAEEAAAASAQAAKAARLEKLRKQRELVREEEARLTAMGIAVTSDGTAEGGATALDVMDDKVFDAELARMERMRRNVESALADRLAMKSMKKGM